MSGKETQMTRGIGRVEILLESENGKEIESRKKTHSCCVNVFFFFFSHSSQHRHATPRALTSRKKAEFTSRART